MGKITIFYDGTGYTFIWLKTLIWAKEELKAEGYSLEFRNIKEYFPASNSDMRLKSLEYFSCHGKYDIVFLAYHHSSKVMINLSTQKLLRICENFKERCQKLVWLDTADSTGCTMFEVLPVVDLYLKKQILRDIELYHNEIWGGRIFFQYYHHKYNTENEGIEQKQYQVLVPKYKNKINISWNVGLGDFHAKKGLCKYLKATKMEPLEYIANQGGRKYDVHYRGSSYPSAAGYQRYLCKNKLLATKVGVSYPEFYIGNGKVPRKEYIDEVKNSKGLISPFGWGEICTRDFEAFCYGATLLKPDMSHLVTFPNWYIPEETYIPIDWDFGNLDNILEGVIEQPQKYKQIANAGQEMLRNWRETEYGKKEFAKHLINQIV